MVNTDIIDPEVKVMHMLLGRSSDSEASYAPNAAVGINKGE